MTALDKLESVFAEVRAMRGEVARLKEAGAGLQVELDHERARVVKLRDRVRLLVAGAKKCPDALDEAWCWEKQATLEFSRGLGARDRLFVKPRGGRRTVVQGRNGEVVLQEGIRRASGRTGDDAEQ